jgi:hypothetical protein
MSGWIERFERAGLAGRVGLLASGAVRLAATAAEAALDRAATIAVDAREAFRKELDPNVSDAKVIEETDERG